MPDFDFDSLNSAKEEKKTTIISQTYEVIITKDIHKGKEQNTHYNRNDPCMSCGKEMYGSGESGGCVICDKVLTETELKLFLKLEKPTLKPSEIKAKVKAFKQESKAEPIDLDLTPIEPKKIQPKITKPEIKKNQLDQYPLVPIDIKDADKLSVSEAKQEILKNIELYNFTLNSIVNEKDFANIQGKKHLCKSGVRKIQLALNISTEIIREEEFKDDKQWVAKFVVKAIAPNGRFATSIGVCEQNEKGRSRTLHDTIAIAQTRATSRAILDLVGFGAVSASEVDDSKDSNVDVLDLVGK